METLEDHKQENGTQEAEETTELGRGEQWTMTGGWERPMPKLDKLRWEKMGWGKKG